MNPGYDQDKGSTETGAGEGGEDDLVGGLARAHGGEARDAGGVKEEADEERGADGAKAGGEVAPDHRGNDAGDPEGLFADDDFEGLGLEEGCCPGWWISLAMERGKVGAVTYMTG